MAFVLVQHLEARHAHNMPIDHFFRSLAQEQGSKLGVILSGMASDGTLGLKSIKAEGGKVSPAVIVRRLTCILEEEGLSRAGRIQRTGRVAKNHDGDLQLLLTDVVMPRMSGRERLVPQHDGMRIPFMSGHTEDAIVHHGVLEPGVAFLPKPFTPHNLLLKVRRVLDKNGKRNRKRLVPVRRGRFVSAYVCRFYKAFTDCRRFCSWSTLI
jgi:CheY-like chemotaxis protein